MKKIDVIRLLVLMVLGSGCSGYFYKKGNKEFDNMSYVKAIKYYQRSLEKKDHLEARTRLAHAYRLTNDIAKAEAEYDRLIIQDGSDPACLFYLAKMKMEQEKYDEARTLFKKYLVKFPNDVVAKMLLASCQSVSQFKRDTTLFTLNKVEMDNVASVFGCVAYKDGMVCTAEREVSLTSKRNPWTGKSFLDLYFTQKDQEGKWIAPQVLRGQINGQYHEGPATFSSDENTVYFTRSNYFKGNVHRSSKGVNNLKIFKAEKVNGKWKNIEEMPFNSDEYSTGHPSLAPDGMTLYFVSDMPGGYGGTDIYLSFYDGGKWSPPMNLGPVINTPGNEMFPYAYEDGSFYFASDAHNSMGGLDVFVTWYDGKHWLRPENLNYPLNSSKDDFAFSMVNDSTGVVSSSRSDTDHVYTFTKHPPKFVIEGVVRNFKTKQPLANAKVRLLGNKSITLMTDAQGRFKADLENGVRYTVIASMQDYFSRSEGVNTAGVKYSQTFTVNFDLVEMVLQRPIVVENIYYDLDRWEIRADAKPELDKLAKTLQDNPGIFVELSSHTDSRAGDQYNLVLSDKRAQSVVSYLILKGIDPKRLTWKGYGETMLVNQCRNKVSCSESEHQANRRTEFKVTRIVPVL